MANLESNRRIKNIEYAPEFTTVWSFPQRGNWATHNPSYRGNFAPQIARNIIEMYSQPGQTILDPMVGGGTTLIECKLLGRNGIGLDINPQAVQITKQSLKFNHTPATVQQVQIADARNISFVEDESIDLVLTHPPYLNIIKYSEPTIEGDLSGISSAAKFCDEIEKVAGELFRVLKPDKYCAILIGDTRKGRHYVPLAFGVMRRFQKAGFILKEDIVKVQHNCSRTGYWKAKAPVQKFYLIMHEHLFVFRKPDKGENTTILKNSAYNM